MCLSGYHHNCFAATHALGHMRYGYTLLVYIYILYIYIYIYIYINVYSVIGINKNYIFHNFKFHKYLRSSGEDRKHT